MVDNTKDAELADASSLLGSKSDVKLPEEARQQIEQARILNLVTAAIAGCSWGQGMSAPMRRAYAEYCRRYDVDPVTEMDNLGGTPYVNAEWYMRKLGELRLKGVVSDYFIEHIHADKRLREAMKDQDLPEEMRKIAREKWFSMLMKRVAQNAPEDAAACATCTIILPEGTPIVGCKWAGNGTSTPQAKGDGVWKPNPIAEYNPTLFVETSSIRRAARQLFSHLSAARLTIEIHMPDIEEMSDEIEGLQKQTRVAVVEKDRVAHEAAVANVPRAVPIINGYDDEKPAMLTAGNETDRMLASLARGKAERVEVKAEPGRRLDQASSRLAASFANMRDPYDENRGERVVDLGTTEIIVDPCPPDPANPTPFDPDVDEDDIEDPADVTHYGMSSFGFSKPLTIHSGETMEITHDGVMRVGDVVRVLDEATREEIDRATLIERPKSAVVESYGGVIAPEGCNTCEAPAGEPHDAECIPNRDVDGPHPALALTSEDEDKTDGLPFESVRPAAPPKPKKKCLSCERMVSGPFTSEHSISCTFHLSNR